MSFVVKKAYIFCLQSSALLFAFFFLKIFHDTAKRNMYYSRYLTFNLKYIKIAMCYKKHITSKEEQDTLNLLRDRNIMLEILKR